MLVLFEYVVLLCVLYAGLNVLFVRNPVQSLLWLIFSFLLMILEFIILGAEFVALLFLMIYIGAIAVLFLFVIMMLNIKIIELSLLYLKYLPIGGFVFFFFFIEICFFLSIEFSMFEINNNYDYIDWLNLISLQGNVFLIGNILYIYYSLYFCLLGIILFIAMIGSIVLIMYLEGRVSLLRSYDMWTFIKFYKI